MNLELWAPLLIGTHMIPVMMGECSYEWLRHASYREPTATHVLEAPLTDCNYIRFNMGFEGKQGIPLGQTAKHPLSVGLRVGAPTG